MWQTALLRTFQAQHLHEQRSVHLQQQCLKSKTRAWFRPQGSKRDGMSSASQPATMRWATGTEKPTCRGAEGQILKGRISHSLKGAVRHLQRQASHTLLPTHRQNCH